MTPTDGEPCPVRCGARTRGGGPCRNHPVRRRRRCRLHGGAKGSGAPRGNRNALKHGRTTAAALAERRAIAGLIRESLRRLAEMERT
ncbi:MAG TPA: HGGxSTG domain-containing protein [Methylomirabilota bacterium]|nr:HGGxSTG domain-containing protein [Methylomirabilota bacterium]